MSTPWLIGAILGGVFATCVALPAGWIFLPVWREQPHPRVAPLRLRLYARLRHRRRRGCVPHDRVWLTRDELYQYLAALQAMAVKAGPDAVAAEERAVQAARARRGQR